MTTTELVQDIQQVVDLRNKIQTAIAANEHIVSIPPPPGSPPGTQPRKTPTGQLVTASGAAHALALQLLGHLRLIAGDDKESIAAAEKAIATVAPAPGSLAQ